eukprot:m.104312 g.104312  ORF g.104312 m.104312 type:complete len:353 (-) comp9099_c0_seq2:133-1191(-)
MPVELKEDNVELLGVDSAGNVYKWTFQSSNELSNKVFGAMQRAEAVSFCSASQIFYPEVLAGRAPTRAQRCVKYRDETGVRSFIVDDDGCDCITSLSMGHGICGDSHDNAYAQTGVYGVDQLYDPACQAPVTSNGLTLYFRERIAPKHVILDAYGGDWIRFWKWAPGAQWPCTNHNECPGRDVLGTAFGECHEDALFCFGRIPPLADRADSELLAVDDSGNVVKWDFGSSSCAAIRAWAAFHDHEQTSAGSCVNGGTWSYSVLAGSGPNAAQDSFMYRDQNNVISVMMDDDNCDCLTSLSMGHGMCGTDYSSSYGTSGVLGVDRLNDPYCDSVLPANGLTLYVRSKSRRALV